MKTRARVCVCVCVCVPLDSSETIKVIIIKFGTVTTSGIVMHSVLIILTLAYTQGHTYITLNVRLFQKDFRRCLSRFL